MLRQGQEIIYTRNEVEILRLTPANIMKMDLTDYYCVRDQPFLKEGNRIVVPGRRRSASITSARREGNELQFETASGASYSITYEGIDLEKVLADGKNNGVNRPPEAELGAVADFPFMGEGE